MFPQMIFFEPYKKSHKHPENLGENSGAAVTQRIIPQLSEKLSI
jgi:hypothetical protein